MNFNFENLVAQHFHDKVRIIGILNLRLIYRHLIMILDNSIDNFMDNFTDNFKDGFWTTILTFSYCLTLFWFQGLEHWFRVKVPLILFLKYDFRKDFTAVWPSVYTFLLSSWLQLPAVSNTWNSGKKNIPLTSWHFPPNSHFH